MSSTLQGQRIAILGGGLIGLFSAHYLAKAGAEVVIVEQKLLGSGAARGNGGLVVAAGATPLAGPGVISHTVRQMFSASSPFFVRPSSLAANARFLYRFARLCTAADFQAGVARLDLLNVHTHMLYRELKECGIAKGVTESGILRVFKARHTADADREMTDALASRGLGQLSGAMMGPEELRAYEPSLGPAAQYGFVQNGEAFASPSIVVDELIASLSARGVEVRQQTQAVDVLEQRGEVRVITDQGEVRADKCLIAMGAWSRDLAARLGLRICLVPGKGYSFSVEPETMPQRAIALGDAHAYATPIGAGKLRLAGTMEFDGDFTRFNANRIAAIKAAAMPYLRDIDWSNISQEWVAPRPMTPDGAPYIGKVPGRDHTFIAAGHNMLGFSLGPATGSVVAEMMAGEAKPALLQAFSPTRGN